ncbi:hypothetical protein D3C85_779020 [compost metagenome]
MIRSLILLIAALVLTGCGHQQIVEKTVTKYVVLDESWFAPCPMVEPPPMREYLATTEQGKADVWARKYLEQAGVNGDCNIRMKNALMYQRKKAAETTTVTCVDGVCE